MKKLQILIDADMLIFETCAAIEIDLEWETDLWTVHADANQAKTRLDDRVQMLTEKVIRRLKYEGEYEILMCLSDTENFRKRILPSYKANRVGKRKPVCYKGVVEWVKSTYATKSYPELEADDCVGILSTLKGANTVSISADKDFRSIPGKFYNYQTDTLYVISKEEADYWHHYQTLVGDVADNYKGCPGVGKVSAEKILKDDSSWEAIVATFEKKGLTSEEALLQGQVARILRASEWDFKNKTYKLWFPNCPT